MELSVGLGELPGASWERLCFLDLYRPEDDSGGPRREFSLMSPLVDEAGHAYWGNAAMDITVAELERSAAAGAVQGDPHRLYLNLVFPQGDLLGADWATTLTAIKAAASALAAVGGVYGGLQALLAAKSATKRGLRALERNHKRWSHRRGTPRDVLTLAARVPRTAKQTAELLDCSEEDAEAILAFMGYVESKDGLWRRSDRVAAQFLTDNAQFAIEAPSLWREGEDGGSRHLTKREIKDVLSERADRLGTSGDAPDFDWTPYRTSPPEGLIDRPFGDSPPD